MTKLNRMFEVFEKISDEDILYGIELRNNKDLLHDEMMAPTRDNSILIAVYEPFYDIACLYIEMDKDLLATFMAYENS